MLLEMINTRKLHRILLLYVQDESSSTSSCTHERHARRTIEKAKIPELGGCGELDDILFLFFFFFKRHYNKFCCSIDVAAIHICVCNMGAGGARGIMKRVVKFAVAAVHTRRRHRKNLRIFIWRELSPWKLGLGP